MALLLCCSILYALYVSAQNPRWYKAVEKIERKIDADIVMSANIY